MSTLKGITQVVLRKPLLVSYRVFSVGIVHCLLSFESFALHNLVTVTSAWTPRNCNIKYQYSKPMFSRIYRRTQSNVCAKIVYMQEKRDKTKL